MTTRNLLPTAHLLQKSDLGAHRSPPSGGSIVYLCQGRDWTVMACQDCKDCQDRQDCHNWERSQPASHGPSNPRRPMCHLITLPP